MAFTYDLTADGNVLIISKIRLQIGDTKEDNGPRPDGSNFSDEELLQLYATEGNHLKRAEAAVLEVLATEWSAFAGSHKLGPEFDMYQQAQQFRQQAQRLRDRYGYGDSDQATAAAFSIAVRPAGKT